jgi:hypothetical protein
MTDFNGVLVEFSGAPAHYPYALLGPISQQTVNDYSGSLHTPFPQVIMESGLYHLGGMLEASNPDTGNILDYTGVLTTTLSESSGPLLLAPFPFTDTYAPEITNLVPARNAQDMTLDGHIEFDLIDIGSGIDLSTVVITFAEAANPATTVYDGSAGGFVVFPASNFRVPESAVTTISNGYHFVFDNQSLFEEDTDFTVTVTASDNAATPNTLTDSYTFHTLTQPDTIWPQWDTIGWNNYDTNVAIDTTREVKITDASGIDQNTIQVWAIESNNVNYPNWQQVYYGGAFASDFSASTITAVSGNPVGTTGYSIVVDRGNHPGGTNWQYGSTNVIYVKGFDLSANQNWAQYYLYWYSEADPTPPPTILTNSVPAANAVDILGNTNISCTIEMFDEGQFDIDTLTMFVDELTPEEILIRVEDRMILNGVFQSGYTGMITDISDLEAPLTRYEIVVNPDVDFLLKSSVYVQLSISDIPME